jgi:type IV pilus assembly protein PilV
MKERVNHPLAPGAKSGKGERGFTLLEILFAIGILTFGILAIASMQVSSMWGNAFARDVTEASTWAGDEIEKLITLSWDDPLLEDTDGDGVAGLDDQGFDNDPATQSDSDQAPVTQGPYTIYLNVADDVVIDDTKSLSVIVTWTNRGVQRRLTVCRVIPRII